MLHMRKTDSSIYWKSLQWNTIQLWKLKTSTLKLEIDRNFCQLTPSLVSWNAMDDNGLQLRNVNSLEYSTKYVLINNSQGQCHETIFDNFPSMMRYYHDIWASCYWMNMTQKANNCVSYCNFMPFVYMYTQVSWIHISPHMLVEQCEIDTLVFLFKIE